LTLKYDELISSYACTFDLRRYMTDAAAGATAAAAAVPPAERLELLGRALQVDS
jgi:hypothetical protein